MIEQQMTALKQVSMTGRNMCLYPQMGLFQSDIE